VQPKSLFWQVTEATEATARAAPGARMWTFSRALYTVQYCTKPHEASRPRQVPGSAGRAARCGSAVPLAPPPSRDCTLSLSWPAPGRRAKACRRRPANRLPTRAIRTGKEALEARVPVQWSEWVGGSYSNYPALAPHTPTRQARQNTQRTARVGRTAALPCMLYLYQSLASRGRPLHLVLSVCLSACPCSATLRAVCSCQVHVDAGARAVLWLVPVREPRRPP